MTNAMEGLVKNGKILQILNDFVVKEDFCNLSCDYCLTEGAELKDSHQFVRESGVLNFKEDFGELKYLDGYALKKQIDTVSEQYLKFFDSPILKISGGEILLVENITEFLNKQSAYYEVIQILTNGTKITMELIKEWKKNKKIQIQLSLDGHTYTMNRCRMKTPERHNKLMQTLDMLVQNDIPVELYCVLTKINIDSLTEFAAYLQEHYDNKVHLAFFPVRQGAATEFLPSPENLDGLRELIKNHAKYQYILPPLVYMEEMYDYLKTRRRKSRCYVPLMMFQNFDDGIVTPCPNCWTIPIGNLSKNEQEVINEIGTNKIYHLMTSAPPLSMFCQKCFTDYHVINMYIESRISLEELAASRHLFRGERVRARLIELKEAFSTIKY